MSLRFLLLSLCLGAPAALGCSSNVIQGNTGSGGSGGDSGGSGGSASTGPSQTCIVPSDSLELSFISEDGWCSSDVVEADGAFVPGDGGFTVGDTSIEGVVPAIPQGTLVRLTYGCQPGFYGPNGGFVRLHNLSALDGVVNPTESGSRLWYFAAARGAVLANVAPFQLEISNVCQVGAFPEPGTVVQEVEVSGPGFDVVVSPSSKAMFTATSGSDAGSYTARNINTQQQFAAGGDAWNLMNFSIERAD